MKKQRKHYTPEEKVAILRKHLVEGVAISDLCDELGLQPTVFYRWLKEFLENGAAAFQQRGRTNHQPEQERIAYLEKKIQTKDEVSAELMAEHVALKKKSWGTLTGVWVPHDTRDQIVDFVLAGMSSPRMNRPAPISDFSDRRHRDHSGTGQRAVPGC